MGDIGLLGAFLGGVLALLSPCAALLLPAFFAFSFSDFGSLLSRTGLFLLGLLAVLVPLGAGMAAMGSLLTLHRDTVTAVGGAVVIVLGVAIIVGRGFGFGNLSRLSGRIDVAGPASVFALGAVYGFTGFCSGPLLGAVLTVALVSGSPAYGGAVMAAYAVGMAVPLLGLAACWDRIGPRLQRVLRGREVRIGRLTVHTTSLIAGLAMIGIGALMLLTDGTASLGSPVSAATQFRWQSAIADATSGISDLEVATALVAIAVAVLGFRELRRRRGAADQSGDSDGS